jgi:hypothetical protein
MKKLLIILLVIVVVLVGAAIALPIIFKDDIKLAIQKAVSENVKARVYFDENKIGVSLFKSFPDLTLTLRDFGVVGIGVFEQDTLFSASRFAITVDIKSIISGSNINLKSIGLDDPNIFVLVLEDGTANYDIMIDSGEETEEVETEDAGEEMKIGIQSWKISNGHIVYYDQSMDFIAGLYGLNHEGSGDFTTSVFDMDTHTDIEKLLMSFGGVDYLRNQKLIADITMNMDLDAMKFTFRDNSVKLNDFGLQFDGFFAMPAEGFDMDINFKSGENTFKSLFSLIPAAYMEGYESVRADGTFSFEGFVRGLYSDSLGRMPAFKVALNVLNGMIQYPDLPQDIKNVNIDLLINNADGVIDNTVIDMKKFHMEFGQNPIDATLLVQNLRDYRMKAAMQAKFNFADVLKILPMDSTEIAGILDANLNVDGVYDSVKHVIPANGTATLKDFVFVSPDLPQGMKISSSKVDINTSSIAVDHFNGTIGKSDMSLKGFLSNYVDYIFNDDAVLLGKLDFNSKMFDANEWMSDDTEEAETPEDTTALEIVQIPKNIDFTLNSSIGTINYDNLVLTDFKGMLFVKDGILRMDQVGFNTLGGKFGMEGTYDTRDIDNPLFDFTFNIKDLSIPVAYQSFNTIQKLAPIAKIMEGLFSTDFKMGGKLQKDYMPDLSSLKGNGLINIANAKVSGGQSNLVKGISSATKLAGTSGDMTIKDMLMKAEIIDGRVYTEPFNVNIGGNNSLVAGSSGVDGSLDYKIKMDVPAAAVGAATSLVSSVTGQNFNLAGSNMKLNLGITGNFADPKVSLLGAESGSTGASAKEQLKASITAEKEKVVEQAKVVVEEKKQEVTQKVDSAVTQQKEAAKEEINKEVNKAKDKLKKLF